MANSVKQTIERIIRNKFSNDYSPQVEQKVEEFLTDGRYEEYKNQALDQEFDIVWKKMMYARPKMSDYKELTQLRRKLGLRISIFQNRQRLRIVAYALPILLLAVGLFTQWDLLFGDHIITKEYAASKREVLEYDLADNSHVWINSGSKITYEDGNSKERVVTLEGEAYFKVANDDKKPFRVKTPHLEVVVVGTEFDLADYPGQNRTIITLDRGAVKVILSPGQIYELKAGQQFIYDNSTHQMRIEQISDRDSESVSCWREGKVKCYKMTLSEILGAIERKFDVDMKIENSAQLNDKELVIDFSGDDTPAEILQILKDVTNEFEYELEGRIVRIY